MKTIHAFSLDLSKLFLEGATDKEVEEQIGINRRAFKRYRQRYGITAEKRKKEKQT